MNYDPSKVYITVSGTQSGTVMLTIKDEARCKYGEIKVGDTTCIYMPDRKIHGIVTSVKGNTIKLDTISE